MKELYEMMMLVSVASTLTGAAYGLALLRL